MTETPVPAVVIRDLKVLFRTSLKQPTLAGRLCHPVLLQAHASSMDEGTTKTRVVIQGPGNTPKFKFVFVMCKHAAFTVAVG